jgi:hypothetical protein
LIFGDLEGGDLNPDRFSRRFVRSLGLARSQLGADALPMIRIHDLRHTHASLLLAAGVPVKVVSERLGHATVMMTTEVHAHTLPGMQAGCSEVRGDHRGRLMVRTVQHQRLEIASWTYQGLHAVDKQAGQVAEAPDNGAEQVEILLFVTALRNVVRGAEALLGYEHEAVKSFYQAVPNARAVREMLEHFDAYVRGIGNLQMQRMSEDLPVSQWRVYYSSNEPVGGERRIHVDGLELEVRAAATAAWPGPSRLQAGSIRQPFRRRRRMSI